MAGQRDHRRQEQRGVDQLAQLGEIDAVADMGRGGGEHVATRRGDAGAIELILRGREQHGPLGAADHCDGRCQQAVVGTDEHSVAASDLDRDGPPSGAGPRVDGGQYDPRGDVADRPDQRERTGPNVVGLDAVGEIDDADVRCQVAQHRLDDADVLVGGAVVGEERDRVVAATHAGDATGDEVAGRGLAGTR